MVFGNPDGNRIVRSWAGPGTLDTYYQTADGGVWRSQPTISTVSVTSTIPEARGQIIDGRIVRSSQF